MCLHGKDFTILHFEGRKFTHQIKSYKNGHLIGKQYIVTFKGAGPYTEQLPSSYQEILLDAIEEGTLPFCITFDKNLLLEHLTETGQSQTLFLHSDLGLD